MTAKPPKKTSMADAAATTDGLQNVVAGLGTSRDKMAYSQYAPVLELDDGTLENMYRGSALASNIVDYPADDMTRAWRTFMFDDEENSQDTLFAIEDAERKFGIKAKVNEALKWGRLYGGAVLLLGIKSQPKYEEPLNVEAIKKDDLQFVHVLDKRLVSPSGDVDWQIDSQNFMQPMFYSVNGKQRVHHSRIIKFIGRKLPYYSEQQKSWWGDSDLQRAYSALLNKDTSTAAIATMLFESNVDVLQVEGLADMLASNGGEAKLTKRYQVAALMKSFNRLFLLDATETYDKKSNNFSGLEGILREFRAELSAASGIPVTRLFGVSATGLNATGENELRNYYDRISGDQEARLRPALEMLDEVLVRSALGAMPDDYRFAFNPLWQMSDSEQATLEKTRADRDKVYFDMGVLGAGAIAKQLKEDGTYSTMTSEDVELAEELENEPQGSEAEQAALIEGVAVESENEIKEV